LLELINAYIVDSEYYYLFAVYFCRFGDIRNHRTLEFRR